MQAFPPDPPHGTALPPLKDNIRMKMEYVPIDSLHADPLTTKRPPSASLRRKLKKSASKFGLFPIIVDAAHKIIDGHAVWQTAISLGYKSMPVIRVEHLNPVETRLLSIALNRLAELGEWDEEKLGLAYQEISLSDPEIDLEATGNDYAEIDAFIESLTISTEGTPDPADEPLLASPPVCQLGDLWYCGKHRILCADALIDASYAALMQGQQASAVCADFPFNVPIKGHVSGNGNIQHREFAMASGEMSETEFITFLTQACKLLAAHSVPGSLHYLFMDWRHVYEMMTAGRATYTELKNICVWAKDNGGMGSFYRSQHELIFIFKNGKVPHRNNIQLGRFGRNRTNVWNYPSASSMSRQGQDGNLLAMHPTVKPIQMIADALLDCTVRGDIVLDSFMGSGTTLLAAQRVGRICYGIELDPLYVDTAIRRWQRECGRTAIHAETGKTFDQIAGDINHE